MTSRLAVILLLGTTQTLAWASSYYLPAVMADAVAADLGISGAAFFAAFSASLLVSAAIGPKVGRTIDALGGRGVLLLSNVCLAAGLFALAQTYSIGMLAVAWLLLGIGMGLGLYDSAFATLGRIYGANARSSISAVTLVAGFASTVGWPLSQWGISTIGWRETCMLWAAAHLVIGLPLNALLPATPRTADASTPAAASPRSRISWDRRMVLVAVAMASAWMVTAAMAAHLPRLLQAIGVSNTQAIAAGMLIGPAQVAARVLEASALQRFHPLVAARLATIAHPAAAALLALFGPAFAAGFAVLHGAGNGILTIARGTVPLALFGPENYGYRLGLIGAPARLVQAAAPLLFGVLIDRIGGWTLAVSTALSLIAFGALISLSAAPASPQEPAADADK
jgi:predicted MFS family arabinose efflux permease